jgi:hypothetical protein
MIAVNTIPIARAGGTTVAVADCLLALPVFATAGL